MTQRYDSVPMYDMMVGVGTDICVPSAMCVLCCNTLLQHPATLCTLSNGKPWVCYTYCNTLQHTAHARDIYVPRTMCVMYCNTLLNTTSHCSTQHVMRGQAVSV